jgi:hypothetical protein
MLQTEVAGGDARPALVGEIWVAIFRAILWCPSNALMPVCNAALCSFSSIPKS